ncbi:MAG TPA: helix-turn-helix domain-containing protein [Rhodothermales bacterium]|nr:helix-turn-helix domain-containing protein [Rhodothermales bacterium]
MDKELFETLSESIEEAGAYLRGDIDLPDEQVTFIAEPDPRTVRRKMHLSQSEFAALLGVSLRTLQNWEQGRRSPTGPAMQLLKVAAVRPDALLAIS